MGKLAVLDSVLTLYSLLSSFFVGQNLFDIEPPPISSIRLIIRFLDGIEIYLDSWRKVVENKLALVRQDLVYAS